ncbi:phage GP46 family protein [Siccirubricoccus sp. KC 17139]|uniref:Phage GP46 family protein n=1 Tax=Siccirubricoccus soli TaxID=2899147 RepID=A0ABT1CYS6_9PROT|nr:phage GP46 family protein [Siccirubricoccus soli]MCO6414823.1 phage GP46 family protein [Siccirubricoccus soli]MCP2680953.1 phage GP46 family protein [Siccirubricoccus soli]
MADIRITWDKERNVGDWSFVAGNLATDADVYTAVVVSLFTDRVTSPDILPPNGLRFQKGWWGDAFSRRPVGSRLYLLHRAKKEGALLRARDYCNEALNWLVEDRIARSVEVKTWWLTADALAIHIVVTKPDGSIADLPRFEWAWRR